MKLNIEEQEILNKVSYALFYLNEIEPSISSQEKARIYAKEIQKILLQKQAVKTT